MTTPQDHQSPRPTVQQMLHNALQLQGANFAQKGQLDMMATKIILALKVLKDEAAERKRQEGHGSRTGAAMAAYDALGEIGHILSMTRDETAQARKGFEYPDVRIQAVINEAAQKLCDILLEDGK